VLVLVGSSTAAVVLAVASAAQPRAVGGSGALLPPVIGFVLLAYAAVAVHGLLVPGAGGTSGAALGGIAGVLWLAEVTAGGPVFLPHGWEVAVGAAFAATAVVTTVAAGVRAARIVGGPAGLRAGLYAGLVSGLMVFVGGMAMTLMFLDRLGTRADYQRQLAHSHLPGMGAFLVQDALTGTALTC
jgi:hypothetical protein